MTVVARLLLAAVFAVAAVAKLADRDGARRTLTGFGVPDRLVSPFAILLPLAELAVALALVPATSARYAAVGAAALLALFTAAVVVARLRGRKPDCHCFGRLHSKPAGAGTVLRNVLLAAVAVLVVLRPGEGPSWVEMAVAAAILAVAAQAVLLAVLLRRYGRALRRIEELEAGPALAVGAPAPHFQGLGELLAMGRPVLLVFSERECPACRQLDPQLEAWTREHADELTISVVNGEALALYGVGATPSAVLVGTDGRVGGALVTGGPAIEQLVRDSTSAPAGTGNGSGSVATAAALAGGLAVTAAANAGPRSNASHDPELRAIDGALRAAGPKLVEASRKSHAAVQAQATLKTGKAVRAKRRAAVRALAAERRQVLALRARIEQLPGTSAAAHNVKGSINLGLMLLAQSLQKQERALGAEPKRARVLLGEGEQLFVRSLGSLAAAATLMEEAEQ